VQRKAKNRLSISKKISSHIPNTFLEYNYLPNGIKHGHYEANIPGHIFYFFGTSAFYHITANYVEGKLNGDLKIIDFDGRSVVSAHFINGKKFGTYIRCFRNEPIVYCQFLDDIPHGVFKYAVAHVCGCNVLSYYFRFEAIFNHGKLEKILNFFTGDYPTTSHNYPETESKHLLIEKCVPIILKRELSLEVLERLFLELLAACG